MEWIIRFAAIMLGLMIWDLIKLFWTMRREDDTLNDMARLDRYFDAITNEEETRYNGL